MDSDKLDNLGLRKLVDGYYIHADGYIVNKNGHKLVTHLHNGYMRSTIFVDGYRRRVYIHKAVADAFLPRPKDIAWINAIVRHKNKNKLDNHVYNLYYADIRHHRSKYSWCYHCDRYHLNNLHEDNDDLSNYLARIKGVYNEM